ncbi:cytochrome P450 [Phanerochaete sordida]|uniref:Cytochrome P450 n=1 Tax=Phanerochaete sordida TaxID=48140 RepID=A0A9P3FXP2_9APHY|nr:cytochrome P450 [Phanerochaete sordida]
MELGVLAALLVAAVALQAYLRRRRYRLPPGPKGLPVLGNKYDIPEKYEWLAYERWGREFGSDVIYLNFVGTPVIVLNSMQAINDLLEKRSAIYSDRPVTVMAYELVGIDRNFGFIPYGDVWREHRRLFHQYFRLDMVPHYHARMLKHTKDLLRLLLATPNDLMRHLRFVAGASILSISYGIDVDPEHDHYVEVADEAIHALAVTGNAGSYLVDYLPILKYVPSWFPGAKFKRDAAVWREKTGLMISEPFEYAKRQMEEGKGLDCVTAVMLAAIGENEDRARHEKNIAQVLSVSYIGGADTTVSALATFVLAMMMYPDIQRTAQAQLDRVVGPNRLPSIEEKDSLPYVTAVLMEALRWRPVIPLAVPHKVTQDDEYKGYHIPKGSIVIGNVWAVLHDETRYPNPDVFDPTRFLTPDGQLDKSAPDPTEACFGFGRRICAGRYFALDAVWTSIACILSTLDIAKPLDAAGKPVEPSGEYTTGLLSHPVPFDVSFKARSKTAEALIQDTASS